MIKPFSVRLLLSLTLLCLAISAFAAPQLKSIPTQPLPGGEVKPGEPQTFSLTYQGDPPTALTLVMQTPGGDTVRVPTRASGGDPATGVVVSWPYTPTESGTYRYHFEATAGDLGSVRYPASPENDPQFVSPSLVTRYVILIVGLLVALLFLPFVVYVAARSLNKRGDPAAAARIALLLGVLASLGLYLYLFMSVYGALGDAIAAIGALAVLIVLFSRRRAV